MGKLGELMKQRKDFLKRTKTGREYVVRHKVNMNGFVANYEDLESK